MPPGMKTLKFDMTLMTGTLERNFKRCTVGLMKAWRDFGTNMKKSNSFLEASNAIYMFGKKGVESILKLTHPYEQVAQNIIAVGIAIKGATAQFEAFEKAGLKASNAFKTGGIVKDFDKFKGMIQAQTAGGMGNITDAMGALGSVRKSNPALNSGEFSAIAELSTGAAAFNGEEYADAFERLGEILGEDSVSLEKLTSAGINFTFNEWQQVKAMNNRMMMHERNRIIIEKMKQTYKDAEKAEANTLSGMYRRIGNMLENLKVKLGEAIAPLAKPFFQLAVLIMNIAEGFIKPFMVVAKVIGTVFQPLTLLLTKCAGLCRLIGTLLGIIVTVWIAKWIKGQLTIIALNINFTKIFVTIIKGWRDATRYLQTYITMMKLAGREQARWAAGKAIFGSTTKMRAKLGKLGKTQGGGMVKGAGNATYAAVGSIFGTSVAKAGATGGLVAGFKALMSTIGSSITQLGTTVGKFAGPVAIIVIALMSLYNSIKSYMKGFFEAFNAAGKSTKSFTEILGQVWSVISRILKILWDISPAAFMIKALGTIMYYFGKVAGTIFGKLVPALETVVGAVEGAFAKIDDIGHEVYFKAWEKLGFDMSKQRQEYEDSKNKKAEDKGFMPADIDFSSSFEGAASMTQRIQTALVSKNSPQAKMVDYLHDIRDYMKGMNDAQNKQVEAQKEDNALMKEQNKKLGNLEPGLA